MGSGLVLVVEDDPNFRKLLQVMLPAMLGVRVLLAGNGNEALEALEMERPEVVLFDLNLPGFDGLELARRVRANPATRDIPLIAVTAMSRARDVALAAGCDEVVEKPFELEHLIELVRGYLQK